MTITSDFVEDLAAIAEFDAVVGGRAAVPINAIIAQVSPEGEAVAVTVNDGFSALAYSGQRYRKITTFQIDIYANGYMRLMEMKDALIDRYHGATLTLGSTTFHQMKVTFSQESAAALNDTVYRCIITLEAIT